MQYLSVLIFLFLSLNFAIAEDYEDIDLKLFGNFDLQSKSLTNSEEAKQLGDDWDTAQVNLIHLNLGSKLQVWNHALEFNWFTRYSHNTDYQSDHFAPLYAIYPTNLLARNVFRLNHADQNQNDRTESIINQAAYEWIDSDVRFKIGRFFIDYGEGYFYNPINPFNIPMNMSTLPNSKLGNDGLRFAFTKDSNLHLYIYILGDKQMLGGDDITRTAWIRGDWQFSQRTHINYVLGEDQKRHKYGLEWAWFTSEEKKGKLIAQALRETQRVDKKEESEAMLHLLLAYQRELTGNWSVRVEAGTNDKDDKLGSSNPQTTLIPMEHYVAISNNWSVTDAIKLRINFATSPETGFNYTFANINYQYRKNMQFQIFAASAMGQDTQRAQDENLQSQLYIPDQVGLGIKSEF